MAGNTVQGAPKTGGPQINPVDDKNFWGKDDGDKLNKMTDKQFQATIDKATPAELNQISKNKWVGQGRADAAAAERSSRPEIQQQARDNEIAQARKDVTAAEKEVAKNPDSEDANDRLFDAKLKLSNLEMDKYSRDAENSFRDAQAFDIGASADASKMYIQ